MASIVSAGTTSGTALNMSGDTSGVLQLASNNGTTAVTIDTSQNVGIGTTPNAWTSAFKAIQFPSYGCVFQKTSASSEFAVGWNIYAGTNATNINDSMYYKNTGDVAAMYSIGGQHAWWTAGAGTAGNLISWTQAMTLFNNGALGIGRTNSNDIAGNGSATGWLLKNNQIQHNSSGTNMYLTNTQTGAATYINFYSQATSTGTITTNGTLTVYGTTSDYRLKENITPMTGALALVAQLKPVNYKWKSNGENSQGFIAHELQAVVPDCVTGAKDATREQEYEVTPAVKDEEGNITTPAVMGTRTIPVYQNIDTSYLVATLTAAIQEQQALIVDLQDRLAKAGL